MLLHLLLRIRCHEIFDLSILFLIMSIKYAIAVPYSAAVDKIRRKFSKVESLLVGCLRLTKSVG